jgi:hypothetical protein
MFWLEEFPDKDRLAKLNKQYGDKSETLSRKRTAECGCGRTRVFSIHEIIESGEYVVVPVSITSSSFTGFGTIGGVGYFVPTPVEELHLMYRLKCEKCENKITSYDPPMSVEYVLCLLGETMRGMRSHTRIITV